MHIIFAPNAEVEDNLKKTFIVLDLQVFENRETGVSLRAKCLIEPTTVPVDQLKTINEAYDIHNAVVAAADAEDWLKVRDLLPHAFGLFGGHADTFYQALADLAEAFID